MKKIIFMATCAIFAMSLMGCSDNVVKNEDSGETVKSSSSSDYSSKSSSSNKSHSSSSSSSSDKDSDIVPEGVYEDGDAVYVSDGKGNVYAQDSDGNSYMFKSDGTSAAIDGKGNAVADTDGDGKIDRKSTDNGNTWKDAD